MRNIFILVSALLIFSSYTIGGNIAQPNIGNAISLIDSAQKLVFSIDNIASMKTKEAVKIVGRKLTLKEKISLKIAQ